MHVYFKREKMIGDDILTDHFIVNTEKVCLVRQIEGMTAPSGHIKYKDGCTLYISGLDVGIDVDGTIDEVMSALKSKL